MQAKQSMETNLILTESQAFIMADGEMQNNAQDEPRRE